MTEPSTEAPASRGGWPKGKPRKPQIDNPDEVLDGIMAAVELERAPRGADQRSAQRGEQRLRRESISNDQYWIDPAKIPDGMSYNWKRYSYGGKVDATHQRNMMVQHWKPVPRERHPEMAWVESTSNYIEKDGLILMERPAYLTEDAHRERVNDALANDKANRQRLELEGRGSHALGHGVAPKINTGYDLSVGDDE